jgi:hypothetical protein
MSELLTPIHLKVVAIVAFALSSYFGNRNRILVGLGSYLVN